MQSSLSGVCRAMHATKQRDGLGVIDCAGGNATHWDLTEMTAISVRGDDVVEAMVWLWLWL